MSETATSETTLSEMARSETPGPATKTTPQPPDDIWQRIRDELTIEAHREPHLADYLRTAVLQHPSLEASLSWVLASKLLGPQLSETTLRDLLLRALEADPQIGQAVRADLRAVMTRDPACPGYATPLLFFKGFLALQAYRVAHYYWRVDRRLLARMLQSRVAEVFAVDIHPAARIGRGIMFDHATSVVIGATAVVEDDFSMLHEVTLGGTGKQDGVRHPTIRRGVMIGAGAKVLGNIEVGEGAKIGAGSVVLQDVPAHTTVAGVPAKPISFPEHSFPALEMDQSLPSEDLFAPTLSSVSRP